MKLKTVSEGVYRAEGVSVTVTRSYRPTPGGRVTEWEAERNGRIARFDSLDDLRTWLDGMIERWDVERP